jgi:hypothetical protein
MSLPFRADDLGLEEEFKMDLKAALGLSQLFSMIVFVTIARWYVMPWLKVR